MRKEIGIVRGVLLCVRAPLPPPLCSVPPLPLFSGAADDESPGCCCALATIGRGDVHKHAMRPPAGSSITLWTVVVAKGVQVAVAGGGSVVEACIAGESVADCLLFPTQPRVRPHVSSALAPAVMSVD